MELGLLCLATKIVLQWLFTCNIFITAACFLPHLSTQVYFQELSSKVNYCFLLFQCSIDKKLGLFSDEGVEVSPLAAYEGCKLEPSPTFVKPHDIWVQVIFKNRRLIFITVFASYAQLAKFLVMIVWVSGWKVSILLFLLIVFPFKFIASCSIPSYLFILGLIILLCHLMVLLFKF